MSTPAPRWTRDPRPGVITHRETLPAGLADALRVLSDALRLSPDAFLVAAHGRVLAALTGESCVEVGHAMSAPSRLEVHRLHVEATSWRSLVTDAGLTLDAGGTPGTDPSALETAVVPAAHAGQLPGSDLRLSSSLRLDVPDGELVLAARAEDLDHEASERIAGYLVAALGGMAADLDARADQVELVSLAERSQQLSSMDGPVRPLPDARAHHLIEDQARRHPDRIAARCGSDALTYAELNRRANRVAAALLAADLQREDVVAVVTERGLNWLVAVLAIFKAGGAYLPVEPHFPAERIATMLRRAECRLALTDPDSVHAVPAGVRSELLTELVADAGLSSEAPSIEVTPDQLAYIYFTSGSTGTPKGAMCEQAGMLNHLFAKIEDLGIAEGSVVAQVAPQCFDISLWQLISGLMVGGTTVIVPQSTILDASAMVQLLRDEHVEVLQVVPSYLEVLLTQLDTDPLPLPDLRIVSVTGEPVKKELVERWFAARPGVALVNAYGLTETSDDTNHEVMTTAPSGPSVPLGRPVRNVTVYVVDPELQPVPLGAPGEIVFSGVCVGRGYINDPERTAAAFGADPHRPGQRLYRSGDFGRWRPDGTLQFLGRRDSQLKISGFRIEIGEIENTMLTIPGVRDAAVVAVEQADGGHALVGFYAAEAPIDDAALWGRLRELLPHYMVPPTIHWRGALPLSDNGKIDKKALIVLAGDLAPTAPLAGVPTTPVRSPSEQQVAEVWARVLRRPSAEFGPADHFFDQGGTSLSAVKVVIGLDRLVSLKEVTGVPVLADLARLVEARNPVTAAKGS